MIRIVPVLSLALAACNSTATAAKPDTVQLHRDLADYATATCFAAQQNAYLKDQGERWAGAVMQRAHGPVEQWTAVADAVAAELKARGIAAGQGEGPQSATIPLPVMTCGQIAATATVRAAIERAASALAADYAPQPTR